jgi:hypothetical protein
MKITLTGISFDLHLEQVEAKPRLLWSVTINGVTTKDVHMLILPDDHKVGLSVQPVDAKGHPAQLEGDPTWSVADPTIATVTPVPYDGQTYRADLVPGDNLGTTQVNVSGDADLGEGVTTITGLLDVQVVAGQAVSLNIAAGTPEPLGPTPAPQPATA